MDFSDELKRLCVRGPTEIHRAIIPVLVDLTKIPNQKGIRLGREFTQGVSRPGIAASYNRILGAVDVSVKVGNYGRRVYVYVDERHADRVVGDVRKLNSRLESYSKK